MIKETNKLWHKKNSIESTGLGQLKLKRRISSDVLSALNAKFRLEEPNFLLFSIRTKLISTYQIALCRSLSRYDQHVLTDSCADSLIDQLKDFLSASSSYLPSLENVDFFLGLFESSQNFYGLLEFSEAVRLEFIAKLLSSIDIQVFALMPRLEQSLIQRGCTLSVSSHFTLNIVVCCIGYLSKYLPYLLYNCEELTSIWRM